MKGYLKRHATLILLTLLTLIGTLLHFHNLNWGAPFYFNPDERNIASAVSQLHFPDQMNPHFFAYGSLPIYTIYFTGIFANLFSKCHLAITNCPLTTVTFEQAILIGRIYSALFANILIPFLFVVTRAVVKKYHTANSTIDRADHAGLFAAALATFSTGFIQFAHFGTFEMWLTLFSVLLFWYCIQVIERKRFHLLLLLGCVYGILVAIKVSSLALLPLPILAILLQQKIHHNNSQKTSIRKQILSKLFQLFLLFGKVLFFTFVAILLYVITNPFVILDTESFLSSMQYESSVGLGTLPVFYTGGFFNTVPFVYQFLHVYPFIVNPLLILILIPAFFVVIFFSIKRKNVTSFFLLFSFLLLLISQSILFVKWTRYLIPTLPFVYIIVAVALSNVFARREMTKQSSIRLPHFLQSLAMTIIVLACMIFSLAYFKTAFINQDTRLAALTFAKTHITSDAPILSEPYDLGIVPFQSNFMHVDWFNFYELDNNSPDATEINLKQKLATNEYIILPSQRILQPRIQDKKHFPKAHVFYTELLTGKLGYHKIYETPCDLFCQITYLGDPIYWFEQTANVFDRPTVLIFKK